MTTDQRTMPVIGLPVAVTDYEQAAQTVHGWASESGTRAVSAANTHIAVLYRSNPSFREVMNRFDLILPDGMPLVWCLNARGAGLKDRVYGPYFMERVLRTSPPSARHFLFGSTAELLEDLQREISGQFPSVCIAGSYAPPFGAWGEEEEARIGDAITEADPHYIWVSLGGGKQETWIAGALDRYPRGVFFAVGDAFALLAGRSRYAPALMQRMGLTWLHRLAGNPRRLLKRYLLFNSLFIWYLFLGLFRKPSS